MNNHVKSILSRILILVLAVMMTFTFTAADSFAAVRKPTKIVVTPSKKTLYVGKSVTIKVKRVKPAKASKAVTFKSSKKSVATVSKKGVVKAKKKGKAVITVTSKKNKKVKAKVTITVKAKAAPKPVPAPRKSLVVYFSRGENIVDAKEYSDELGDDFDARTSASVLVKDGDFITGNNGFIASWISEAVGAPTYSIKVTTLYPKTKKETQNIVENEEQMYGLHPAVEACTEDLTQYDNIFLGFPNWHGEPPRALYTFLENNFDALNGKTILPFTSYEHNMDKFSDGINVIKSKLPKSVVLDNGLAVNRREMSADLAAGTNITKEAAQTWALAAVKEAESAQANPLATVAGQKEAAEKLVGQTTTEREIIKQVGEYLNRVIDTNGCTHDITSVRYFYPGFVIYCRAVNGAVTNGVVVHSID